MPYTVWSAKSMRFSHGRNRTVFTLSNQSLEHLDLGRVLAQLRLTGCRWAKHLCLITILSGFEINNFVGQAASGSAITLLPCLTCFGSGSEPCFAGFGRAAV